MSHIVKLLVVANPNVESEEVRDAIVQRAAAGPVHITLIESWAYVSEQRRANAGGRLSAQLSR